MQTYPSSQLTEETLNTFVTLYEADGDLEAWKKRCQCRKTIFGCYTITDDWTFVRGVVQEIETERPTRYIEFSPRYNGVLEAERIFQILKSIVAQCANIST